MHAFEVVALGFDYPNPGRIGELTEAVKVISRGQVRRHMTSFIGAVGALSLGEWEELHTLTLDLSPQFVPYIGHVQWGENYRRGAFMAELNQAMDVSKVDRRGELPDHIAPVLRYLARVPVPLPELLDVLPSAVASMQATLTKSCSTNPYRHLLAATSGVIEDLAAVSIGGRL